jgi:Mrp family chromosome partitioning ATPase
VPTIRVRIEKSGPFASDPGIFPDHAISDTSPTPAPGLSSRLPEVSSEVLKLSANLQASVADNDKFILVAGFNEGESSEEISLQLAAGLSAMDGQSVLLVDANLRNPWLHDRFGIGLQPGLTNVLSASPAITAGAVRVIKPNLAILPAGTTKAGASIFTSTPFSELIELELYPRYRFIIVNSAPFGQFADANLIASRADGVVITLTSGRHHRNELVDLKNELESMKSKIVGTVLCEES